MRFLHCSDWHLGRMLYRNNLIEDQSFLLEQLKGVIKASNIDALVIAGDLFDRANPPKEAVRLLSDFLHWLLLDLTIPVIAIAGNHDHGEKVEFASSILAKQNCHLVGSTGLRQITLYDHQGPVIFDAFAFANPAEVRDHYHCEHRLSPNEAWSIRLESAPYSIGRRVFVGHLFAAGGSSSDSERELTVGGSEAVPAGLFKHYDYLALGHLHRPQAAGQGRYSGSLLKYSFSEADHEKSVTLVDLGTKGYPIELIPLIPRRDLRIIEGTFDDLLNQPERFGNRHDYLLARITDHGALIDPMDRLKAVYPHCLRIERPNLTPLQREVITLNRTNRSEVALFDHFFNIMTQRSMTAEEQAVVKAAIEKVNETD